MNQKTVGLTLRATILALALILVVGSPALLPLDGVAYAQSAAPTLTATVSPNNSVAISWTAVDGADSYELYKQEEGAGSWNAIAVTGASHTDSAVDAGKSYFYIVRAMTGGTAGAWSNTPKVTIPGGTTAPTGKPTLTATVDGLTAIDLSWTAVSGADHYDLRRWNGATSSWDRIGGDLTGTTHADTGLTSGEQYWYVMRAVNAGGNGPWSSEGGVGYTTATLPATDPVPTLSLTHPSRTTVILSWTPVAAGAEYTVQRRKDIIDDKDGKVKGTPGAWSNLASSLTATSYTDSAATHDGKDDESTQYEYRVYALVDSIQSNYSNTVKVTIPATDTRPPAPTISNVTVGGHDRLNITWTVSAGATSYQVRHKRGDGSYSSATTRTSPWTHTGLSAETAYTYQVRAVNVNGSSDWSAAMSKTTSAATSTSGQLDVPSGLNAVDATTIDTKDNKPTAKIKVTWNLVSNADNYDLMVWKTTQWEEVALDNDEVTAGEVTYPNVTANTEYHFVIRATAGTKDMGDWSAPVSASTVAEKPKKPKNLTVSPTGESTLWISWADDGSGVDAAASYTLDWRRVGGSWTSRSVDGTTYAHTGLRADTEYLYRVQAHNSNDDPSGYTHPDEPGTTWAQQLSTPTGLAAVGGDKKITLSWNAVSAATAYELQKWSNSDSKWEDLGDPDVTGTTFLDDGNVNSGETYYYIVRAVNGNVKSDWSTPVAGSAKADAPSAVDLDLVPTGQTMVRLTWKAVPDATSYEMQWIVGDVKKFLDSTALTTVTLPATPNYYAHTGLTAGTRYSYRLRAVLPQSVTSEYQTDSEQVVTRPLAPAGLSATAIDATTMELTFDVVNLEGEPLTGASDYEIQRRASGSTTWKNVKLEKDDCKVGDECSVEDKDLTASTKYFYRVRATAKPSGINEVVTSYWSMVQQRTSAAE